MDAIAREVCQLYAVTRGDCQLVALGNHGGFSGARLWRVHTFVGKFCLRRYPKGQPDTKQLERTHDLMNQAAAGLAFVPRVLHTSYKRTFNFVDGRYWELTTWLPGVAGFEVHPTLHRLRAAMTTLAKLHRAWEESPMELAPCPAIVKRLTRLVEWQDVMADRAFNPKEGPFEDWCRRAWEQHAKWWRLALVTLRGGWLDRPFNIQDCLCDIWHDHVLFEGNHVSGIVDYGSVRLDSVAVDLARLIGSLVGDDVTKRQVALAAYESIRPLTFRERELVDLLDWTGVVVGAGNWLRWLLLENRQFEDISGVIKRLSQLVTRMESWNDKAHGWQPVGLIEP